MEVKEIARTAMRNFIRKYGSDKFREICAMMENGVEDRVIGERFGFTPQNANRLKQVFGRVVTTIDFHVNPEDVIYEE